MTVVVTAANIQDRQATGWLLTDAHLCGVKLEQMKVWADQGYTGEYVEEIEDLGVALAVFLGQNTPTVVNQVCQDIVIQDKDETVSRAVISYDIIQCLLAISIHPCSLQNSKVMLDVIQLSRVSC
ncbi:MAG: hypothetical protein HC924_08595 [Synechococcaceae cyanobacterium SM2_3_2]|nr:hypothetical protein [Synechococcaceae cyanobacterium SM2_3_2]